MRAGISLVSEATETAIRRCVKILENSIRVLGTVALYIVLPVVSWAPPAFGTGGGADPLVQLQRQEQHDAFLLRVSLSSEEGQLIHIEFVGVSTRLTPDAQRSLESLAAAMIESDSRVQLKAYADGNGVTQSSALRVSLSRALAVRSFLMNQGMQSERIDVSAVGRTEQSEPTEHVDILLISR